MIITQVDFIIRTSKTPNSPNDFYNEISVISIFHIIQARALKQISNYLLTSQHCYYFLLNTTLKLQNQTELRLKYYKMNPFIFKFEKLALSQNPSIL